MRIQTVSLLLALIVCCHVGNVLAGIISGNSVAAETTVQLGTQAENRKHSESTGPQGDFDHLAAYRAYASLSLNDGQASGTVTALATAKANHLGVMVDLNLSSSLEIQNEKPVAYNAYGTALAGAKWEDHVFVSFRNPLLPFNENSALEMIVDFDGKATDIGEPSVNSEDKYAKNDIVVVYGHASEKVFLELAEQVQMGGEDDRRWYAVDSTEQEREAFFGWNYENLYSKSIPSQGTLIVRPDSPATALGALGPDARLSADVTISLAAVLRGESVGSKDGHPGTNSSHTTLDYSHTVNILGFRFYDANGDMMDPDLFQVTSQTGYQYASLGPEVSAAPEPSSLLLAGMGVLGMAAKWRRQQAKRVVQN